MIPDIQSNPFHQENNPQRGHQKGYAEEAKSISSTVPTPKNFESLQEGTEFYQMEKLQ